MSAGAEAGGGRLDHDLVAPPAQRGIVRAERPDLAVADRPRPSPRGGGHPTSNASRYSRGVAERCLRFGRGVLDDRQQLGLVVDAPDAGPAAAGGGLEHHGEAERRRPRRPRRRHRRARPPFHGTTRSPAPSASRLTAIRSRTRRSTSASGPRNLHAEASADRGRGRILGRRRPSRPQRVDVGGGEGAGERVRTGAWRRRRPSRPPARSHRCDSGRRGGRPRAAAAHARRRARGPCAVKRSAASTGPSTATRSKRIDRVVPVGLHRSAASRGPTMSAAGGAGEGDGLVAGEADEHLTVAVEHDGVDAAASPGGHDRPAGGGLGRPPARPAGGGPAAAARGCRRRPVRPRPAVWKHSSTRRGAATSGPRPVRGSAGRSVASSPTVGVAVAPHACQHLVGGAVEVDPVDRVRGDDGPSGGRRWRHRAEIGRRSG